MLEEFIDFEECLVLDSAGRKYIGEVKLTGKELLLLQYNE